MLEMLRNNYVNTKILISPGFKQDINWFNTFLTQFNGLTYYDKRYCNGEVHLDACLTGGCLNNMVYLLPIPKGHMNFHIVQLEIINFVVAIKICASYWSNQRKKIHCDNLAVVEDLKKG